MLSTSLKSFTLLILSFFILTFFANASPNEADAFFITGNEYYQSGNYKAAIAEYQKIIDSGYESWEVYYNIGNAYFKDGQVARAILNFERAKKLNPKNEDINYNLELANLSTVDRIQELPRFFLADWLFKFSHLMSLQTLGFITVALYLILMILATLRTTWKPMRSGKASFTSIIVAGILLVLFTGIFSLRVYENETNLEAIILVEKVDVKSAPDDAGTDVFTLHEGVKVQIKDRSIDWVKIRLADGKVGWLKEKVIEKI